MGDYKNLIIVSCFYENLHEKLLLMTLYFKNHNNIGNIYQQTCPGYYCGRRSLGNGQISDCGSCPTGTRVNSYHMCEPCIDLPTSYDWMYLLFMATVPLLFHAVYIDLSLSSISWASQKRYIDLVKVFILYLFLNLLQF